MHMSILYMFLQVTLATFATYIVTGGILDAGKAFTALSLFNILRFPMNMLPAMINYLVTVSIDNDVSIHCTHDA